MSDQSGFDTSHYYALPVGSNLFEFRIEQVLGHGGFGITYLATDTNLDERVAIKEYMPSEIAVRVSDSTVRAKTRADSETLEQGLNSFLEEARTIARFRHRNIVHVRRFFRLNGTAYIVLEYEYGQTLGQYLETYKMGNDRLRDLLSSVLDGLDVVHTRATLHRDLKPSNIVLRPDQSPVLIDFGAARNFESRNSRSVTAIATAGYSPPEQSIGGQQGPWTDLYALGAIAYRIVSGTTPPDSLRRLRKDPLVPASSLDVEYDPAILRTIDWMLKIDESERPISVDAVRASLAGATFDAGQHTLGNETSGSGQDQESASDNQRQSLNDFSAEPPSKPLPLALRPTLYIAGVAALVGIAINGLNFYRDLAKQNQNSAPMSASLVKTPAPAATQVAVPPRAPTGMVDRCSQRDATSCGWVGLRLQQVTEEVAKSLSIKPARGALIAQVEDNGPAKPAGIQPGDVVIRFDGKEIGEYRDLPRAMNQATVGKYVDVVIIRNGKEQTKTVTVGRLVDLRPVEEVAKSATTIPTDTDESILGLRLADISDDSRMRYAIKNSVSKGVVVTKVDSSSDAAKKGLKAGEVIVEVAQEAISNVADVRNRVEKLRKDGKLSVLLLVSDGDGLSRFIALGTK